MLKTMQNRSGAPAEKDGIRDGKVDMAFRRLWDEENRTLRGRLILFSLLPLSLIYRSAVTLRNGLFEMGILKQRKMRCPVISVGNLTVGGTGKTPLAVMLANVLRENGYRPAVLSRGYGSGASSPVTVVSDGERILAGCAQAGDEPLLIARSCPGVAVLTGASRTLAGRRATDCLGADILILDDGFQHRHVARDINILLMDRARPFGNGFLLPAGPLREPRNAMDRADLIIVTDSDDGGAGDFPPDIRIRAGAPLFRGVRRPKDIRHGGTGQIVPLTSLRDARICAFSGIGSPESFRKTLRSLGAELACCLDFPDHHRYHREDLDRIEAAAAGAKAAMIVTTEKDGVHLEDFPYFLDRIFFLRIAMEIVPNGEGLQRWVLGRLARLAERNA